MNPTAREFANLHYLFDAPFVTYWSKYQHVFGGEATSYREGIRQTLVSLGLKRRSEGEKEHLVTS